MARPTGEPPPLRIRAHVVGSQDSYPLPGRDRNGSSGKGRQVDFELRSTPEDNGRKGWRAELVREAAGRFLIDRLPERSQQQVMVPPDGAIGGS